VWWACGRSWVLRERRCKLLWRTCKEKCSMPGSTTKAIPETPGTVELEEHSADGLAFFDGANRQASKYFPNTRRRHRRRDREEGLCRESFQASNEVLPSLSPYFGLTEKELKIAAQWKLRWVTKKDSRWFSWPAPSSNGTVGCNRTRMCRVPSHWASTFVESRCGGQTWCASVRAEVGRGVIELARCF